MNPNRKWTNDDLLTIYNAFTFWEYGDEPLKELPDSLNLIYTSIDIDDEEYELQVDYNVKENKLIMYADKVYSKECDINQIIHLCDDGFDYILMRAMDIIEEINEASKGEKNESISL